MADRLILAGALLLVGCGSTPIVQLPLETDTGTKVRLTLDTKAQILVVHTLASGVKCDNAKAWMRVKIRPVAGGDDPHVEPVCGVIPKTAIARTKEFLPPGQYDVRTETNMSVRFLGKPLLTANPLDPEAKSGPDQDFGGAVELAENQTVKGTVSHTDANATNWIAVKSKGEVSLFFLPEAGSDLQAKIFQLPKGAKSPQRLGALAPKSKRHLKAPDGMIYVQITAKKYEGSAGYTLTRRDTPGSAGKAINVAVIDCYPVNASSSVVILKASDAIKVNDELQISARKGSGASINVGKCTVTSISESQASCRMEAAPTPDLSNYKAQLVKEEGHT